MRFETCSGGRKKERCRTNGKKVLNSIEEGREPSDEQLPFSFGRTHVPVISICLGLLDTNQGYADNLTM